MENYHALALELAIKHGLPNEAPTETTKRAETFLGYLRANEWPNGPKPPLDTAGVV